jgi:AhpD family alkylhydroperoxidase
MTTITAPQPLRPAVAIGQHFPAGYKAVHALEQAVAAAVEPTIFELVKLRASQINGCAYCLDMHYKDARAQGETELRLSLLRAWREVDLFTEEERAALALTVAITLIADHHVPEDVEAAARDAFDEEAYAALVFAIITINAWNRLAITSHSVAGEYAAPEPS